MHFANVGNMFTAHAISAFCAPDCATLHVCTCTNWLCNNIECNYNVKFLPNIWTQAWNVTLLGHKFATKTVLTAVNDIFYLRLPYFGDLQVCVRSKWISSTICNSCNGKLKIIFWIITKFDVIWLTFQTCTHAGWLEMMLQKNFVPQNLRPDRYAY